VFRLAIDGLEAGYGAVKALHGVSLEVRQGETVALLGTNGNGKSTLMKCIMGLLKPAGGSIVLEKDGERVELTGKRTHEIVALGVAMVPEGRRLFPKLSVRENLLLGAYRRGARGGIEHNLALCHEAFPVLQERSAQLAGSMSGGQQQMLAIARAIMSAPRLLLVDEPSVGLSPVLVSAKIAPGPPWASTPCGPSATSRNAASSGTAANITSEARAHSAALRASRAPRATSFCRLAAVREKTLNG